MSRERRTHYEIIMREYEHILKLEVEILARELYWEFLLENLTSYQR